MSNPTDKPYPEGLYVEGDPAAEYEEIPPGYEEGDPAAEYDEAVPPPEGNGTESPAPTAEEPTETRRGMRRYRKGDVQIEEGDDEDGEMLVVSIRLRSQGGGGGRRRTYEMEEPESRSKIKRLTKSPAQATTGAAAAPAASGQTGSPAAAAGAPPPGAPLMKLTPRTAQGAIGKDQWEFNASPSTRRLFLVFLGVALAALGYLAGQRNGQPANAVRTPGGRMVTAQVPKLTPVWTDAMVKQLDAVLAADAAGDVKTARAMAVELKRKYPTSPDLTLYLSTLQTRTGDYNDAEVDVSKLIDPFASPLQAAAVNSHLGFIYTRHRDFPHAVEAFSDAAAQDPFNADHFQQWAEVLRRSGQLQEAVDHFRQALVRLPDGRPGVSAQREEIEFKIRLTQIEGGKDDDSLKTAIDSHLQSAAPTGYWLLTAAAYALQHNDMATAADTLRRARAAMAADYAALTNDYFFHSYAVRKEMAGLLPEDTPDARVTPFMPRMGYFIDP